MDKKPRKPQLRLAKLPSSEQIESESLAKSIQDIQQESRMVLPGIQALFGFQLIAVFNARFSSELSQSLQIMHLAALICSALATLLVIAPAAYHRRAEPGILSTRLVRVGGRFLSLGMFPLMCGICLDVYLIARVITHNPGISLAVTLALGLAFFGLWFVYPWTQRLVEEPLAQAS